MKLSKLVFSLLTVSAVSAPLAHAHRECYTECWYDRWGYRQCRTECYSHHHPGPPVVVAPDKNDLAISASILAISATTLAMNDDKQVLVNAAEDAAVYLETGKMTGTLAALVQVARENAAKINAENAASLTEAQLVDGILSAAEQALEQK